MQEHLPISVVPAKKTVTKAAFPQPAVPQQSLVASLRANPAYAAELFALAAVSSLGAEAELHTAWLRETYAGTTADGLARLATSHFVRRARRQGALAGLTGPVGLLADIGGIAWLQARLVLHVAAAYGQDPTDPARAAELLVLLGVHPSEKLARAALEAAIVNSTRGLAVPVKRALGKGIVRAIAARFIPASLLGAITNARSTEQLAVRAARYYRARS